MRYTDEKLMQISEYERKRGHNDDRFKMRTSL